MKKIRLIENKIDKLINEVITEGTSTIRDDYVYIIYDFMRECYDAAYGCDIFDDLRWNNVMIVGGPFVEWTDKVDKQVEELQSRESEEWDYYHGLNESQGVVERGYDAFAEYLWKRCSNCRLRPDRYGDINFTIPAPQWAKFNTYGISTDKISVRITERGGRAEASFGYWGLSRSNSGYPEVMVTRELIESGHDRFIEVLMHELTHSVNKMANLKDKDDKAIIWRQKSKLKRQAAQAGSVPNRIAYLYDPSEINARLTQAYYWLNNHKEKYINISQKESDKQFFAQMLFNDIDNVTDYSEMVKYINRIDEEQFWQNQMYADKGSYPSQNSENCSKYWPLLSHLSYNGGNAHKSAKEFPSFFRNKLKIKGFMQQECEKFKRRIYKMIYKFISENGLYNNVGYNGEKS